MVHLQSWQQQIPAASYQVRCHVAGAPEAFLLPCRPGFRAALKWGTGPQVAEDVAAVWAACLAAMQRVSQLLSQPRPLSDGMRMLAARFLENAMLLISAEPSSTAMAPKAQHALLSAALVSFRPLYSLFHCILKVPTPSAFRTQVALHEALCSACGALKSEAALLSSFHVSQYQLSQFANNLRRLPQWSSSADY